MRPRQNIAHRRDPFLRKGRAQLSRYLLDSFRSSARSYFMYPTNEKLCALVYSFIIIYIYVYILYLCNLSATSYKFQGTGSIYKLILPYNLRTAFRQVVLVYVYGV